MNASTTINCLLNRDQKEIKGDYLKGLSPVCNKIDFEVKAFYRTFRLLPHFPHLVLQFCN